MSRILVGSTYFFSEYEDFMPKDIDEVEIIQTTKFKNLRQITGKGRCLFQLREQASTEDYIQYALQSNLGMEIGKFLVPEFCRAINFSFSDLYRLSSLILKLDPKHEYEKIIFDSYLKNGDFTLTKEQRDEAYSSYKKSRQQV